MRRLNFSRTADQIYASEMLQRLADMLAAPASAVASSLGVGTAEGTACAGNDARLSRVLSVMDPGYGVKADGKRDDTASLQRFVDNELEKYSSTSQQNFYTIQNHPVLFIPGGEYILTHTWDLSFRNNLIIMGGPGSVLKWEGETDGTMLEFKCCSRLCLMNITLDGNSKAGTFIHHAGNGTSENDVHGLGLTGKGNCSANVYQNVEMYGQHPDSTKAILDTVPYLTDVGVVTNRYYYSVDDSTFFGLKFRTGGTSGFAIALGSSANSFYGPLIVTPNGILIQEGCGVDLKLFSPVFSLQANDKGAIYAEKEVHVGNIDVIAPYYEGSTAPFFAHAGATGTGSVKGLKIFGGLFGQNSGATDFISIPSPVVGNVYVSGARVQTEYGRKITAPDCNVELHQAPACPAGYLDYELLYNDLGGTHISGPMHFNEPLKLWMGGSTTENPVPTVAHVDVVEVGNVGTGEDDLMTYALPPASLNYPGVGLRLEAWGYTGDSANAKTLKFKLNTTELLTLSFSTSQANVWRVSGLVFRTYADTQKYMMHYIQSGSPTAQNEVLRGYAAVDDGTTITMKFTGEGTDTNDVRQEAFMVEFVPQFQVW